MTVNGVMTASLRYLYGIETVRNLPGENVPEEMPATPAPSVSVTNEAREQVQFLYAR